MFDSYLLPLNAWVIFGLTFLFYLICLEIGFHWGLRTNKDKKHLLRPQIITIQTSVLGLLALILGFTFSMAITRFETRKHLIIEEANAIGTTYLRAELFKEPYRSKLQNLLKQYLDDRIAMTHISLDYTKIRLALNHTTQLQKEIWDTAMEIANNDSRLPLTSLLLQSLNQMIDLHTERLETIINRLPDQILYLIFLIAGLGLALTGYISGLDGARNIASITILAVLFAAVTLMIIDLDRPGRGMITEKYTSLTNLRESLHKL